MRIRIVRWFVAALALVGLSSATAAEEYFLQQNDVLRMTVFQEEDLTTEAMIGKSGEVSLPLIGTVAVLGKTTAQVEDEVKALYEKDYLASAKVNISVVGYAKKWLTVGGDVRRPGTVPYPEEGVMTLADAIAQGGGEAESGDITRITVRSRDGAVKTYNLKNAGSVALKHGDTVTVPRSDFSALAVTVSGKVRSPRAVEFPKEGGMDILTAIAQAGGFTEIANEKTVTVKRRKGERFETFEVNVKKIRSGDAPLFMLKAGDIVIVNESIF